MRQKVGTFQEPVVHRHPILIKGEFIDKLTYVDGTDDYEFVISREAHAIATLVHFFVTKKILECFCIRRTPARA